MTSVYTKIEQAKYLQAPTLDLSDSQCPVMPQSLFELEQLTELDMSRNGISELPHEISTLKRLTKLNLASNLIHEIPNSIGDLANLIELDLSHNRIEQLPRSFGKLKNLRRLVISSNDMRSFPDVLLSLRNLQELDISINEIAQIPTNINLLSNLTKFSAGANKIEIIPDEMGDLFRLNSVDLRQNNIAKIYPSIIFLPNLRRFLIQDNPITTPPIEIVFFQGGGTDIQAIRRYYNQIKEVGQAFIFEAKLLIVGEGGAGKTTLAKKIINPYYSLPKSVTIEPSTEGVDILKWDFPVATELFPSIYRENKASKETEQDYTFHVNIWDFGGQEIYHATHQFFLTKRSLYILVADTRREHGNFYYWLKAVETLSDASPLLLVKNKKRGVAPLLNDSSLRQQFENFKEIFTIDLAKVPNDENWEELLLTLRTQLLKLPHIGTTLPKTWTDVRKALERDERKTMPFREFLDICTDLALSGRPTNYS